MHLGELYAHCLFIGLNDEGFNSLFIPNKKCLFSETVSPKNHGQVSFDKKIIRMNFLFHLLRLYEQLTQLLTQVKKYVINNQI